MKLETITIVPTKPWLTYDAPRWMRCVEWWLRVRVRRQTGYLIDRWTVVEETIDPGLLGLTRADEVEASNQLDDDVNP